MLDSLCRTRTLPNRSRPRMCVFTVPFVPKQPATGNNRQIGEHQTEGQARHKAEWLDNEQIKVISNYDR